MVRGAVVIFILCLANLAYGQNLLSSLTDYDQMLSDSIAINEITERDTAWNTLPDMQFFSTDHCDCLIGLLFNNRYKSNYPLPPNADMVHLLARIGSSSLYQIKQIKPDHHSQDTWMAEADFSPSSDLFNYDFGWLRTIHRADKALVHYVMLYNTTKDLVKPYMISSRL